MSRGRGRGNSDGASANPSAVRRPEPAQNGHLQVNHILLSIIYYSCDLCTPLMNQINRRTNCQYDPFLICARFCYFYRFEANHV